MRRFLQFLLPPSAEVRKRRLELTVWAFLLSLAYYPGPFGALAWFSLVRPFMIISRLRGREAFGAAYFYGLLFSIFSLYWLALVTAPGVVPTVLIVGLYFAVVLWLFNKLFRLRPWLGIVAIPFLWTGLEYFRTLSQFAFPWSDLGYTQSYFLYILQIVSVISVHGLSILIVAVNVLLWLALRRELRPSRRFTAVLVAVTTVAGLTAYGWIVMPAFPLPGTYPVTVLQGSVPLRIKWDESNQGYSFNLYDSLAHAAERERDDGDSTRLFIWPETSAPSYVSHDFHYRYVLEQTALNTHAYHLVGALGARMVEGDIYHYNSAYLVTPEGRITQRHDKVKLVPFSEQVPYQDYLPFLQRDFIMKYLTFLETYDVQWWSDFRPGDSAVLFEADDYLFGCLICFESTFPEYCRKMILDGADFVVGITNDTWFGHSVGIHMHARILVTRAVENRCWMARAANSGLSYIIDGYGRIRGELPLDAVAALNGALRPLDGYSFFTRHGDIAGWVSFLLSLLLVLILVVRWLVGRFTTSSHSS